MTPKAIENRLRSVAAFSEAGSDLEEPKHGRELFEGAQYIFANAALLANAAKLRQALADLMAEYNEQYAVLTDGEHGRTPGGPAWRRATALIRKTK